MRVTWLTSALLRVHRLHWATLTTLCLMFSHALAANHSPVAAPQAIADKSQQRKLYAEAQSAIRHGHYRHYRKLVAQLAHYPLKPYLQYAYINRRLSHLPYKDVDAFLAQNPDAYLSDKLDRHWVKKLARTGHWSDVRKYYQPDNSNTELHCLYLRARLRGGDKSAYKEVAPLWNVGRSQPKACDPLFARWMKQGLLTDELAWQRFSKAMNARKRSLAKYIAGKMSPAQQKMADLYYRVDRHPQLLKHLSRFGAQTPHMQALILHGLQRLSLRDAEQALQLWHRYDAQQLFANDARLQTQHAITVHLLRQGYTQKAEALIAATPELSSQSLTEWMIRDALRQQDWPRVANLLVQLPAKARNTERWKYWRARVLDRQKNPKALQQATKLYQEVAKTRSFYGFLAADILDQDYQLVDNPISVSDQQIEQVANQPGIVRARELFIIGDSLNARREWYHTTRHMDKKEIVAAGHLADSWGWHRNGIRAMIQIRYWDDLEMRFPLAYRKHVKTTAQKTSVSPHLLYAIARQESAFTPDARSAAGALGLMQLLPSTARQIAHRSGMSFSTYDLLKPATNIALGGRYLNSLLDEFNGNRILATAAYNAGPRRVKQWLNQDERDSLPYDIWIETIPYRETRGYVQNVLAYSVIYGYRLGDEQPFITAGEANKSL